MAHAEPPKDLSPAATWLSGDLEEFPVYRKNETPRFRKAWSVTQAILRRMKQETAERGVRLVVFYVPARIKVSPEEWSKAHLPPDYNPGEVARKLVGICQAEGIPNTEPSNRFREAAKQEPLYYPHDPHLNAAGQHLAGKILAEYVRSSWRGARH